MGAYLARRMSALKSESAFEVLAKARDLEAKGRDIVHLEIGDPDFETPQHIKVAAAEALANGYTHYVPAPGLSEARQAIARDAGRRRGIEVDWRQVVVTPGAKPIMFFTLLALAEEGTEVIYPSPGFPTYESVIGMCGAKAVPLPLRPERNFHPDLEEAASLVTERTRLLILNSPHNPCGSVLTQAELKVLAGIVLEHPGLYVLSDEVYKDILYEDTFHSIASIPSMAERTIILDGLSKSYAMTGWRLGYGIVPEPLVDPIVKLAINSVSCAAAFSQRAIVAALEGPQDDLWAMQAAFHQRRDALVKGLRSLPGVRCPMPEGAFYAFPDIRGTGMSSADFERRALEEAGVALLSGSGFGPHGEGCVRLSYATSTENLERAVGRLREWLTQRR